MDHGLARGGFLELRPGMASPESPADADEFLFGIAAEEETASRRKKRPQERLGNDGGHRHDADDDFVDVDEVSLLGQTEHFELYHDMHRVHSHHMPHGKCSWIRRRTKTEFLLALVCVSLVGIWLAGKVPEIPHSGNGSKESEVSGNETKMCESTECVSIASIYLQSMDNTLDPCDNFYEYVCKNWIETHEIQDARIGVSVLSELSDTNTRISKELLQSIGENIHAETNNNRIKLWNLFDSCMGLGKIESAGMEPLKSLAENVGLRDWYVPNALFHIGQNQRGKKRVLRRRRRKTPPPSASVSGNKSPVSAPTQVPPTTGNPTGNGSLPESGVNPTHLPTSQTAAPTTLRPSNSPTTSFPSAAPTQSPTAEQLLSSGDSDSFSTILANLHRLSASSLFDFSVSQDNIDSETLRFSLFQSGLTLPSREDYFDAEENREKDRKVQALLRYVESILGMWAPNVNSKLLTSRAKDIVSLEFKIARIMDSPEDQHDPVKTYNPVKLEEVGKVFNIDPVLNLKVYVNAVLGKQIKAKQAFVKTIVLGSKNYFSKLANLLISERRATIHDYLTFSLTRSFNTHLSEEFRRANTDFSRAIFGVQDEEQRSEICLYRVEYYTGFLLGRLFVDETFGGSSKSAAESIIGQIKEAFRESIKNVRWMDDETRKFALQKIDQIGQKIGYPDFIMQDKKLESYYSDLKVTEGSYFKNIVAGRLFILNKILDKLGKPVDKSEWHMVPTTVNAYYSLPANEMVFPAAILQPPVFNAAFPQAVNFGSIGAVMAHEITHGFDDSGAQYDVNGNVKSWWAPSTLDTFKQKRQCFVDQYSSFKVGNHNVNGNLTLGENIADNGGLKTTYRAYKTWVKKNPGNMEHLRLPGFQHLSPDQLFFVAFSYLWCGHTRPSAKEEALRYDPHPPSELRVIGSLQNSKDFAEAFNCPVGSPMNPEKKCTVW